MIALLAWLVTLTVASYCAYQVGRRVEHGRLEIEQHRLEEVAYRRSQRKGTVRLSTMQIRR